MLSASLSRVYLCTYLKHTNTQSPNLSMHLIYHVHLALEVESEILTSILTNLASKTLHTQQAIFFLH